MSAMITHVADDALTFETIEAAVKETGRGRWFLAEYARRNRHADTLVILSMLETIQQTLTTQPQHKLQTGQNNSDLAHAILDIGRAIARTQRDIRAIRVDGYEGEQFISASDSLGGVVETTAKATSAILSAAERVQEYAWTMREKNGDETECDMLDACASEIYIACTFQDVTAQRIHKVVDALRFIDERVTTIVKSMGLAETLHQDLATEEGDIRLTHGMRPEDIWMSEAHQAEIDETFEFFTPAEIIAEPTMVGGEHYDIEDNDLADAPAGSDLDNLAPSAVREEVDTLLGRVEDMKAALPSSSLEGQADSVPCPPQEEATSSVDAFSVYDGLSAEERLRSFR